MKTLIKFKYYLYVTVLGLLTYGCVDNVPEIEELPSAAVDFTYKIADDVYKLDYYTGASVEFTSQASISGAHEWDFGDGTKPEIGEKVIHKYAKPGTYKVTLTVGGAEKRTYPILIKDIVPIMSVNPIEGGVCEVLTTPITISMELPNPENLEEEYLWVFPEGTTDENGNPISTSSKKDPGKLKFSNVGSQTVRLQAKLGGRPLEQGSVNVQVGYNEDVPTLYYAVKDGNIMALKLPDNPPSGMKIYPYDMAISSGNHPLNILFNDESLYILDAGKQFTYVNDSESNLGDGRITVMTKDGSKVETMLNNPGHAFDDPFYGYIQADYLYFSNRVDKIRRIKLKERNKVYSSSDFPGFVSNYRLGYYGKGLVYSSLNGGFTKISDTWYWSKMYSGSGIYRFKDSDILNEQGDDLTPAPKSGVVLASLNTKSLVWDKKNQVLYFAIYDSGAKGLYRCTLSELEGIVSKSDLKNYQLKTADGKTVTPITDTGKGEGSTGEFIGICQLALDQNTGNVYFGLRSDDPDVKSGLMRYNASKGIIEHVIENVDVYGVAVNNNKSKLF